MMANINKCKVVTIAAIWGRLATIVIARAATKSRGLKILKITIHSCISKIEMRN